MTVLQLLEKLGAMPPDAVVLISTGAALARVSELELVEGTGPGAPTEVILLPYEGD